MKTSVKLAISVLAALLLILTTLWVFHFARNPAAGPFHVLSTIVEYLISNRSLQEILAFLVVVSLAAFLIFDTISIALFHYGYDRDREVAIFEGTDGPPGPRISKRTKLTSVYPFALVVTLMMGVATSSEPISSALVGGDDTDRPGFRFDAQTINFSLVAVATIALLVASLLVKSGKVRPFVLTLVAIVVMGLVMSQKHWIGWLLPSGR